MNKKKYFWVCDKYRTLLLNYGAHPMEPLVNPQAVDQQTLKTLSLHHALYMVEKMPRMYDEDPEKAMRWLGFVQGVFYITGYMTIEEMKLDNKNEDRCNHGGTFRGEKCTICGVDVR
jgi:hypothetical protein